MNFPAGLALPFRALKLLVTTRKLLLLSLLCGFVAAFALALSGYLAWVSSGGLTTWLITDDSTWKHVAAVGLHVVLFVPLFAVFALTLPNVLLSPLQDPLSEATEAALGPVTPSTTGFVASTLTSLKHTFLRLGLMLLGMALLFPLNLIPAAGSVVYFVLSTTWSAFWLAYEYLSCPAGRHGKGFRFVVRSLMVSKGRTFGFGYALAVLLWVPVLNFFLMPIAVVAGTLLYREPVSLREEAAR